jgi:hypothetical protein
MNDQTTLTAAKRIDEIASGAMEFFGQAGSMEAELRVAKAIVELREALTSGVMKDVIALMNSDLGFDTDQNPKRDRDAQPYSIEVVKDFVIQAKLRGYHLVGNECNIIQGKFYATKYGVTRKARTWPGVTNLDDNYEVPIMREGGAIVKCWATWKLNGTTDRIDRMLPVRVNKMMGSDAILGKAQRKLFSAIIGKLSGRAMPDGEAGDDDPTEIAQPESQKQVTETQNPNDWKQCEIHIGKFQHADGKRMKLGELSEKALCSLIETWTPKPTEHAGTFTGSDQFLRQALDKAGGEKGLATPPWKGTK